MTIARLMLGLIFPVLATLVTTSHAEAQNPTCVELARVGWYEYRYATNENHTLYNLLRTLRTERYRDFGAATSFLANIGLPIGDFLAPFSLSGDAKGWAKFQDVSDSYLKERVELYSKTVRKQWTVNPKVIDLIQECLRQDGVHVALGKSGDLNELPLLFHYSAVAGIPVVNVRLTAVGDRLKCPHATIQLTGGQDYTITCVRAKQQELSPARLDLNVDKSRIREDKTWILPSIRVTPPESKTDDKRLVRWHGFCFSTTDDDKNDNSYAYVKITTADGIEWATWQQPGLLHLKNNTPYCTVFATARPMPVRYLQEGKTVLQIGLNSTNGDTWRFIPSVNGYVAEDQQNRQSFTSPFQWELSDRNMGPGHWSLPRIELGPPPVQVIETPPPVVKKSVVKKAK